MTTPFIDVALLTENRYATSSAVEENQYLRNILRDDQLLSDALAEFELTSERVDWARADTDWTMFRCAVFRTVWDYFDRVEEFSDWLSAVAPRTNLLNSLELVRWNIDKHYLAELAKLGIPTVPSIYIECESTIILDELLNESGWKEVVVKPCISGGARHTYRVDRNNAIHVQRQVQPLIESKAMLLQPFLPNIMHEGEDSLMLFGGKYSHAIRKIAKSGDFRVQDDHGGRVESRVPSHEQIELAERALSACRTTPVYARVDMVRGDDEWLIMELELIEPELWLRYHPPAANSFAAEIAKQIA